LLLGRPDARRDTPPELPVHDPGAAGRHAKVLVGADGGVALQDLASTNGTKVNGKEVASGSRVALAAGDEVTLGRWTRITLVRAGPSAGDPRGTP
jgi:pSer/pThr/pTyr-binding forkhead associated (FHA) protein